MALYGDWERAFRILRNIEQLPNKLPPIAKRNGEEIARRVRENIKGQKIRLEPLKKEYLDRKTDAGRDRRTLISLERWVNHIEVTDIRITGSGNVDVVISTRNGTTETGLSMKTLAKFIEFGTRYQPARMPFHRSWEQMRKEIRSQVRREVLELIKDALQG